MNGTQQFILALVGLLVFVLPVGVGLYNRLTGDKDSSIIKGGTENGRGDHHHN